VVAENLNAPSTTNNTDQLALPEQLFGNLRQSVGDAFQGHPKLSQKQKPLRWQVRSGADDPGAALED
jgi:hypothetical protein